MIHSKIIGTGSYLPKKILTNHDLELMVDTTDDWIRSRTGIVQRHIAADGEMASDMALNASREAMDASGIKAGEIDLIIVATTTPDMIFPSTACILQNKLGIKGSAAFDMQAVCSGFIYALTTADMFIRSGKYRTALVVGTEIYSRLLDWNDRSTCVLFGDGAGAVLAHVPAGACDMPLSRTRAEARARAWTCGECMQRKSMLLACLKEMHHITNGKEAHERLTGSLPPKRQASNET